MPTPLAWLNLLHHRVRTMIAILGVAFAVVLIFMQLGFLGAVQYTASLFYNELDFDICIRSKEYLHFSDPRSFPQRRLYQAASQNGVARVHPFFVSLNEWRTPQRGDRYSILVMGVRPGDEVFRRAELQQRLQKLTSPSFLLIDRETRREFGPADGVRFGDADVGVETELGRRQVRIVGHFTLGTGLAANGAVLMNEGGFLRSLAGYPASEVSLGLVKLQPGLSDARRQAILDEMRRRLPADVDVLSRDEAIQWELDRWVKNTSFGLVFQVGVVVALVVGTAVVYQVLAHDVEVQMPEYATLKAIGYPQRYLTGIVLRQATALACLGYLPGWAFATGLYFVTSAFADIPIRMQWANVALVFLLALLMCVSSGLGALQKLRRADPAELF